MAVNTTSGNLILKNKKVAIVVSRFNELVTNKLLHGAIDILERHMDGASDIDVFWTPGAFEVPQAAQRVLDKDAHHALICLAAVVRGETPHFDYISSAITKYIGQLGMTSNKPIAYGVITADTLEQAIDRAGAKAGNKGVEAALAMIEMVNLYEKI